MGWANDLKELKWKDLNPYDKESAVPKNLRDIDKHVLQPFWDELFQNPVAQAYVNFLVQQARGKYKSLPQWLKLVLQEMAAYDIDLTRVSYAEGIDTILEMDDVRWMLHELEHVVQYKREGGVNKFLLKYIVQSITTAPWQKRIRDIHHNMGLERDAKAKADSPLEGVLRELGDLALGRKTVHGSNLGSFINMTNQVIREGDYLQTVNGLYRFICQGDGNVVLYGPGMSMIWASYTDGMGHPPYRNVAQADGNVVQYDSTQTALWRTGTDKPGNPDCFFILQDDRNLVLYERGQPAKALWHIQTYIKS